MKKLTYVLFLITLSAQFCFGQKAEKRNPNLIIILADDLGYGDLGFTGSKQIKTPNIDRLAENGVWFTQGYVSAPVCSPSRAGILTGRNQVSFGHDNNLSHVQLGYDREYNGMPLSEKTIATRLKQYGYVSGLVGKWHLGHEPQFHPLKRGFDEFWGYTGGGHDYFKCKPNGSGYSCQIECNYKTPAPLTYITDDKGDECVDFIERHHKQPFFLFASFNAPHAPLQATEDDLKLYRHIKDKRRRTYCAMVHRLDVNIGKIMASLKKQKLLENTLIVFLSDNGGPVNSNASLNVPFNGQKGILLEGGIRVPFVMSWKGKLPKGTQFDAPVRSLDIASTILGRVGYDVANDQKLDGVDLLPYVLGNKQEPPHNEMMWRFTISASIRQGDWKLVRLPDRFPMLYNLKKDISEKKDVALQNMDIAKQMLKRLGDWDVRLPHPVFMEGAEWKSRQLKLYDLNYKLEQPK